MIPRLIILDADGVLWRGNSVIDAAPGFIRRAQAAGIRCCLMSNNAAPSRADYAAKCAALGLQLSLEDIFSTGYVAGPLIARRHPGARVLVLGSAALTASVRQFTEVRSVAEWLQEQDAPPGARTVADLRVLETIDFELVLVGLDLELNYLRLATAAIALQRGALLIATNEDLTFPVEGGLQLPGNGSIIRLLEGVSGVRAGFLGKPELYMLEQIETESGIDRSEMLVIGDRVDTDIEMARRAGIPAWLVLTGVTSPDQLPEFPQGYRVAADLDEVAATLWPS